MAKEQYFAHPPRGHVAILAYDDVNNRWQVLECTEDGYLKIRLQEVYGTVLVQQIMPSLLQPGMNSYDGSAWHKQPPIWGYSDSFAVNLGGTKSGDGDYYLETGGVPAGEVWKVEFLSLGNMSGARGTILLQLWNGSVWLTVQSLITPGVGEILSLSNSFTIKAGMKARVYQYSCVNNDDLFGSAVGYKMSIDM